MKKPCKYRVLISKIGEADIKKKLDLKPSAVPMAILRAKEGDGLNPSWFVALRDLGKKKGVNVPESAFAFKGVKKRNAK